MVCAVFKTAGRCHWRLRWVRFPHAPATIPRRMREAFIILNPEAGRGRGRRAESPIGVAAREQGWKVAIESTRYPGEERELATRAADDGWPTVVAAGGDGTVHEVANGLLQNGPSSALLGHIPLGTGNDFARLLGIPGRSVAESMAVLSRASECRFDVGRALGEYFINAMGIGFGAAVVTETLRLKHLSGFALYLAAAWRAFLKFEAPTLEVKLDQSRESGRVMMVEVLVGQTAGGGFRLTPDADPSDGMFDVCLIREVGLLTFLRYLPRVMRGTHAGLPPVTIARSRRVTIECPEGPPTVHLDGELRTAPSSTVEIETLPASLKVLCGS